MVHHEFPRVQHRPEQVADAFDSCLRGGDVGLRLRDFIGSCRSADSPQEDFGDRDIEVHFALRLLRLGELLLQVGALHIHFRDALLMLAHLLCVTLGGLRIGVGGFLRLLQHRSGRAR